MTVSSKILELSGESPLAQFKALASQYSSFAREAGVEVVPFQDSSLPFFRELDRSQQRTAIEALRVSVQICRDTRAQGYAMSDSPSLIWQALKQFGLRPPSDLFSQIHDCTVIELYSLQNIQLFRSFSFFRYCSYTLEELYCHDWMRLFERKDTEVIGAILEFFSGIVDGTVTHLTSLKHIPRHVVREVSSERRFVLEVGINWGAPLFWEGQPRPGAAIFLETGTFIGSEAKTSRDRSLPIDSALSLVT